MKGDMIAVQLQCDKVKRDNTRLETKVIPELERQVEIQKYEAYSAAQRDTVKQLDNQINEKQAELDDLCYVNSQIEYNELAEMDEQITALMKIRADIIMMEKKLNKARKRLSTRYDVTP